MSFSQRQQLTEPFKIATMRQRGYLLEIAPSFQSWFICFFDDRWRQSTLSYYTIDRNARDYYWSLDLLRRGHSPANQWAALGPFQGLRKLYHYYRGTSVGMQYIDDEQIYKHLAAALARGQMEVHKVYDPHEAYRAFVAAAAGGVASTPTDGGQTAEAKPETRQVELPTQSFVPTPLGPIAPISDVAIRPPTLRNLDQPPRAIEAEVSSAVNSIFTDNETIPLFPEWALTDSGTACVASSHCKQNSLFEFVNLAGQATPSGNLHALLSAVSDGKWGTSTSFEGTGPKGEKYYTFNGSVGFTDGISFGPKYMSVQFWTVPNQINGSRDYHFTSKVVDEVTGKVVFQTTDGLTRTVKFERFEDMHKYLSAPVDERMDLVKDGLVDMELNEHLSVESLVDEIQNSRKPEYEFRGAYGFEIDPGSLWK